MSPYIVSDAELNYYYNVEMEEAGEAWSPEHGE